MGKNFFWPENSDFLIFTRSVKLKDRHKFSKEAGKGPGFKIGLNENWTKFRGLHTYNLVALDNI